MRPVEAEAVVESGEGGYVGEDCGNKDHSSSHGDRVIRGWRPAEEDGIMEKMLLEILLMRRSL